MTTHLPQTLKCIVCNTESKFITIGSTNSFGSSDLDLRPLGMARFNLAYEIQLCPKCRFSAPNISEEFLEKLSQNPYELRNQLASIKEFIVSPKYKSQLKNKNFPSLANQYLAASQRQNKICKINKTFHILQNQLE